MYVYHGDGTQAGLIDPARIVQQVTKADAAPEGKPAMQAVFDENGSLVGIVDPADITPVAGAGGKADEPEPEPVVDEAAPQDPAAAGVPADAVGKAEDVTKAEEAPAPAEASTTPDFVTQVTKSVSEAITSAFENQNATFTTRPSPSRRTVIEGQAADSKR